MVRMMPVRQPLCRGCDPNGLTQSVQKRQRQLGWHVGVQPCGEASDLACVLYSRNPSNQAGAVSGWAISHTQTDETDDVLRSWSNMDPQRVNKKGSGEV